MLVKNGKVINAATNLNKTHPLQFKYEKYRGRICKHYLHAEINCCKGRNIEGCDLYIFRNIGNSKPCPSCEQYLKENKIRRIIYKQDESIKVQNFIL